jgi:hypothetical protein
MRPDGLGKLKKNNNNLSTEFKLTMATFCMSVRLCNVVSDQA